MTYTFYLENIKCAGCASAIKSGLEKNKNISSVEVEVKTGQVTIEADIDQSDEWLQTVKELGYPEKS
ncbi:MAG: heavy-metal-associated domain-containing protein [Gammaproteobacteria bacterium]|nr:heavy-metal-associated domain-containing protein [Gammaproteobacteria bacterium]